MQAFSWKAVSHLYFQIVCNRTAESSTFIDLNIPETEENLNSPHCLMNCENISDCLWILQANFLSDKYRSCSICHNFLIQKENLLFPPNEKFTDTSLNYKKLPIHNEELKNNP